MVKPTSPSNFLLGSDTSQEAKISQHGKRGEAGKEITNGPPESEGSSDRMGKNVST